METKICTKCKRELPLDMFQKDRQKRDGLTCQCKDCRKNQYINEREKRLKYQKNYYKNHPEVNEKFETKHKERLDEYRKDYFNKNKERILSYNRKYIKNKMKTDELYRFKTKIRNFINGSLRRKKFKKNNHAKDIVGISAEELQKYLYKTFFDNYGYEYDGKEDVHIDHIIPLKMAETEEDVKRLCHYTNLQLLKATDNIKKSAKMPLLTK